MTSDRLAGWVEARNRARATNVLLTSGTG